MSKILIIEDDRALVDVLAYNLRQAGYEVHAAYDGMDGLTQAQLKSPDVVLLDLMLPVMDGIEVCRRLRSDPHTSEILILMLTAKTEEADQLVGFSVGPTTMSPNPTVRGCCWNGFEPWSAGGAQGPSPMPTW